MSSLKTLIGGALVGAAVTALFTTETGAKLRTAIADKLRKRGWLPLCEVDESEYVALIAAQLDDDYDE